MQNRFPIIIPKLQQIRIILFQILQNLHNFIPIIATMEKIIYFSFNIGFILL